ncbi:MAG: DUF4338 domain-containing protein [Acidimicrobiales bacterium]|jgi:hypothetical protein|nr:DUF4338 domain-containing protein [Acidimicrobiales bacterium]
MHDVNQSTFLLRFPEDWNSDEVEAIRGRVTELSESGHVCSSAHQMLEVPDQWATGVRAAALVLGDLANQGWSLGLSDDNAITASPASVLDDPIAEKERVRTQELLKRDEQLATPSVRRFVARMESPHEHNGRFVSIHSLMRDGEQLAAALRSLGQEVTDISQFREVIDPYVTVATKDGRCSHTGFRLLDIWRYFRYTWANQYRSTPGRGMPILIRDRAVSSHPVIGIASLGSAVIQIAERDAWIGWHPEQLLKDFASEPTDEIADWIKDRLATRLDEIYLTDLIADGLYWPDLWNHPKSSEIEALEEEASYCKQNHYRLASRVEFGPVDASDPDAWVKRAQTDLFRSRRCSELAKLLKARADLMACIEPEPSGDRLREVLDRPAGKRALAQIIRRAKSDTVGTEIADLTVCGAIAPYNELIGGKLVAMLSVSPSVVRAYKARYKDHAGDIASSIAGRPIRRKSNLVFVGTTSLYGSGSSQYNRLLMNPEVLGSSQPIRYKKLGRTRSFGTSHLSSETTRALVSLAEQNGNGIRVNSIFGEGVNPEMRKIRQGLGVLGWPSDQLLRHGRQRILYGVSLVSNLAPYVLGMEDEPDYLFSLDMSDDIKRITDWWFTRWLRRRCTNPDVLERLAENTLGIPDTHRARIRLPPVRAEGDNQQLRLGD